MRGIVKDSEDRTARLLFKMAVDINLITRIICRDFDYSETDLRRLRQESVRNAHAQYLYARRLLEDDDPEEAEHWLKELVIGETKTEDSKRTIYLPDSLWRLLAERKKKSFSDWIFPNLLKPELPLDPSKAYRQLKAILKKGDLPDIRLHDLRHTFTSHAANSGIAPKTLSEIVGHSKASFTLDHYAHVTSDMQKNAANIVTNYITDILGKELKPWQSAEKQAKEH